MRERECTRCGKCCINSDYMRLLKASGDDVRRWQKERRYDILQYVCVLGDESDPWGDLWLSPRTGDDATRCPFVRKDRGALTYKCLIYDTRPDVCRAYKPWTPGTICEDV